MLVMIGSLPYRPWQTVVLGCGLGAVYSLGPSFAMWAYPGQPIAVVTDTYVFLGTLTLICAAISARMYNSRYSGFQARCSEEDIRVRHEESEREYRMLFEDSADGIFEIDNTTNHFSRVNPSLIEMLVTSRSTAPVFVIFTFAELISPRWVCGTGPS